MPLKKSITMKDVAARVGVGTSTVSAVINNGVSRHVRVSEATRLRVLEAARELQYTPNGVARALRIQKTNIIGLYLWDSTLNSRNPFINDVYAGLQSGCNKHRKDLLIHGTYRQNSVDDIYRELAGGKMDGLVLFAEPGDPLAERLAASALPVVTVADTVPGLPAVIVDDAAGGVLLADYLFERGHRRVLYRKGPSIQASARRRQQAFFEAAEALGMQVLHDTDGFFDHDTPLTIVEQEILLRSIPDRPSVVACWNDALADVTIQYCRELGYNIPKDLAIVGFDDNLPPRVGAPQLTTIHAPWFEVAETAVELLVQRLAGTEIPQETVLPVRLVIGETA